MDFMEWIAIVFACLIGLLGFFALIPVVFSLWSDFVESIKTNKKQVDDSRFRGGLKEHYESLFEKSYTCTYGGECVEGLDKKYACACWDACSQCLYLEEITLQK